MAWVASENFNSYSDGDLSGNNGGSGWAAAWSAGAEFDVQGTTVYEGAKAVSVTAAAGEPTAVRQVSSAPTSGVFRYAFRANTTAGLDAFKLSLNSGTAEANGFAGVIAQSGNLTALDATSLGTYAADTWYVIDIEFDCGTDQYRVRIDGGAFSAWINFSSAQTNVPYIFMIYGQGSGTQATFFIDAIGTDANLIDVSDQLNITESVSLTLVSNVSVSDQLTITESITMFLPILLVSVSDSLTITENINVAKTVTLSVFDSITVGGESATQYITSGPNSPQTAADDASVGTVEWSNPGNILASDDSKASAALNSTQISHYLKATNFGFNLPSTAIVTGIKVEIERLASGTVRDYRVRIIKANASIGSTDKSDSSDWPSTDTYQSYGGAGDLWGETWTYTDINDADFGAALAVQGV